MKRPTRLCIVSGSLHSIPPSINCPAVPRIFWEYAKFLSNYYEVKVFSFEKGTLEQEVRQKASLKYVIVKQDTRFAFVKRFTSMIPYGVRKRWFGTANPKVLAYYFLLWVLLRRERADVVLTTMHKEVVPIAHSAIPHAKHYFYYRTSPLFLEDRDIIKRMAAMLDGFISLTRESKEYFDATYSKNGAVKSSVVPNFVDLTNFKVPSREEKRKAKKEYGFSGNDLVLGYAGRLSSEKGVDALLCVVRDLIKEGFTPKILLAGSQKNQTFSEEATRVRLARLIADLPPGTVRRTGWIPQSQMPLFYRVIDVSVLLSSRREGHSMFALESMACGVPLIATAIGGNREIVRHGVNGLLISEENKYSELRSTITTLLLQRAWLEKLSNNCRKHVEENFSFDVASSCLLSCFRPASLAATYDKCLTHEIIIDS